MGGKVTHGQQDQEVHMRYCYWQLPLYRTDAEGIERILHLWIVGPGVVMTK